MSERASCEVCNQDPCECDLDSPSSPVTVMDALARAEEAWRGRQPIPERPRERKDIDG